jgi:hypothetical protein
MVRLEFRGLMALLCCELMLASLLGCGRHRIALPEVKPPSQVFGPLQEELKKSYLTLFETAPTLEYSDAQIAKMQEYLEQAKDYCVGRFENVSSESNRRIEAAQKGLKKSGLTDEERHGLHCQIQEARALRGQADVVSQSAIPVPTTTSRPNWNSFKSGLHK